MIRPRKEAEWNTIFRQWQPSYRLGATVRGGLVVDPARTWSPSHLSSEFDVISGIEAFAYAWHELSFFNVCSVHRADIFKVDILNCVSMVRQV